MIVFVGASASGKTELAKILCNDYSYQKCITTTTRLMRLNEKQDVDYHFISKEKFLDLQSNDEFIEVTHYQDNLYGIQKNDVILNGVVIVDPDGANSLISKVGNDVFIVYVETNKNLRKLRMEQRGDKKSIIDHRLTLDHDVFQPHKIKQINLYIKNDYHSLIELATLIHNQYQSYMNEI